MQEVTNSFPCGEGHLHRMGLRGSSDCTLCQRARNQRVDDQHDGCGRIDPETLGHIQSARCALQHLVLTQGLKRLFKDTQWTVEQMSFVTVHKSVSASVCHDLLSKFDINKEDRVKVIKNLGRTLLDELENLFRSYWVHRLGVSDGLLQVLGHNVRVKMLRNT